MTAAIWWCPLINKMTVKHYRGELTNYENHWEFLMFLEHLLSHIGIASQVQQDNTCNNVVFFYQTICFSLTRMMCQIESLVNFTFCS